MAKRAYKPILPPARIPAVAFGLLAMLAAAVAPSDPVRGEIGRTTAVNPDSQGTPPGRATRVLVPKLDVFADERIETDEAGVAQILFRDGSHMSVGPNSDLVIDRFVYDPDTSAGELAASLGRGVLRFVGGQLSKRNKVTVATPVAVIGVRGGIAVIEHDINGATEAILLFGDEMDVRGIGDLEASTRVTRPGFSVPVGADGTIGPAAPVTPERLNRALAAVEGSPDSDGGATERPNDETVRQSSYAEESAALSAVDPAPRVPTVLDGTAPDRTDTQAPADTQERQPISPAALLRYDIDFMGFYGLDGAGTVTSPLNIVKPEGPFGDAYETGPTGFLHTANSFSGEGANQVGGMHVFVGLISNTSDPSSPYVFLGRLRGTERKNARDGTWTQFADFGDDPLRHPDGAFAGASPPATFSMLSGYHRFSGEFSADDVRSRLHLNPGGSERGPATAQAELQQTIPLDQVANREPVDWSGYATGLFEVRTSVEYVHTLEGTYSLSNTDPTDVRVGSAGLHYFGAVFNLDAGRTHEGNPGNRGNLETNFDVNGMQISFGRRSNRYLPPGFTSFSGTRGVFVDDSTFGGIAALVREATDDNAQWRRLVYVNGQLAPDTWPAESRVWMVSNDAAPATGLLGSGVRYCDCAAARFGWWGGQIGIVAGPDHDAPARADALFPGTFVVGNLPEVADIPSEGTASYTGHAAAAIRNAGAAYAAVGRFEQDWDFAQRAGTARIRSLDGRDYDATVSTPANTRDFTGALTQTAGAGSGDLAGSFFSDGSNPVVDVGGRFTISEGSTYTAVGAFAATSR